MKKEISELDCDIRIRAYNRAVSDELYYDDYTNYSTFKEIIKQFGKSRCVLRNNKLYVFRDENQILMYEVKK